jgi:hypothetical protein
MAHFDRASCSLFQVAAMLKWKMSLKLIQMDLVTNESDSDDDLGWDAISAPKKQKAYCCSSTTFFHYP